MRRLAFAALCSLALISPALAGPRRCGDDVDGRGRSVPCDCGDLLVSSRALGADDPITSRACPGTGLLVDVPANRSATLALGGYVLAGSGQGFGIQVLAGGAGGLTIAGPGGVRGFDVGVFAPSGALALVADVTAADNASDGFRVNGRGYAVTRCEGLRNGRDGFSLGGREYRAEGNRALENGRYGFSLSGRDAAIGGADGNEAAGNGGDGLRVRGRGHDVQRAVATANGGRGISARNSGGRIADAVSTANRGRELRGGSGNRAADCRSGGPCR